MSEGRVILELRQLVLARDHCPGIAAVEFSEPGYPKIRWQQDPVVAGAVVTSRAERHNLHVHRWNGSEQESPGRVLCPAVT